MHKADILLITTILIELLITVLMSVFKFNEIYIAMMMIITICTILFHFIIVIPTILNKQLKKNLLNLSNLNDIEDITTFVDKMNEDSNIKKLYFFKALVNPAIWAIICIIGGNLYRLHLMGEHSYLLTRDEYKYNLMLVICVIIFTCSVFLFNRCCQKIRKILDEKTHRFFCSKYRINYTEDEIKTADFSNSILSKTKAEYPKLNWFPCKIKHPMKIDCDYDLYTFSVIIKGFRLSRRKGYKKISHKVLVFSNFDLISQKDQEIIQSYAAPFKSYLMNNNYYIFYPETIFNSDKNSMSTLNFYGKHRTFKDRALKYALDEEKYYILINDILNQTKNAP